MASHLRLDGTTGTYVSAPDIPALGRTKYTYLRVDGTANCYASCPDLASLAGAMTLTVEVEAALDRWDEAAYRTLVGHFTSSPLRGFRFHGSGTVAGLRFDLGDDAGVGVPYATAPNAWLHGSRRWVGMDWDADDGASNSNVQFKTSPDGTAWTNYESLKVSATEFLTGLGNAAATLKVGAATGSGENAIGNIYKVRVYANGALVASPDFTNLTPGQTSFTDAQGNLWTLSGTAAIKTRTYYQLDGASGSYASTPDSAPLSIVGDIDIRAHIAPYDRTPAADQTIISKDESGTTRSWTFRLLTTGHLYFQWTTDGSTLIPRTSSATLPNLTQDGAPIYVRVTLDVDNGATENVTTFYTSTDGATWTQLGTNTPVAGVTSIHDNASRVAIGTFSSGVGSGWFKGHYYSAQIRNGINGTVVASPVFTASVAGASSVTDAQGNVWTKQGTTSIRYEGPKTLDVEVDVALDDWTPATTNCLTSQWYTGCFAWYVTSTGPWQIFTSIDGVQSSPIYQPINPGLVNGTRHKVGFAWVADNGTNSTCQSRVDGVNHDTLKVSTQLSAGLWDSGQPVVLGAIEPNPGPGAGINKAIGNIYSARIYADGVLVASPNFANHYPGEGQIEDAQGNIWTLNGAATFVFDGVDQHIGASDSFTLRAFDNEFVTPQDVGRLRDDDAWLKGEDFATVVLDPLNNTTTLSARPLGYDSAEITWELPNEFKDIYELVTPATVEWTELILMRSPQCAPATILVGVPVFSYIRDVVTPQDIPETVIDTGLVGGKWYYYSLFLKLPGAEPLYQRVAATSTLVPFNYGSGRWLFDQLPEYYHEQDKSVSTPGIAGPLERYLQVLGYQSDIDRTFADLQIDIRDPLVISQRLIQHFGDLLGAPIATATVTGTNERLYLQNIVGARKRKGTLVGLQRALRSISRYDVDVVSGLSIALTPNDAFRGIALGAWGSVGNWVLGKPFTGSTPTYSTVTGEITGYTPDPTAPHVVSSSNAAISGGTLTMPEGVYTGVLDWSPSTPAARWHGRVKRQLSSGGVQIQLPALPAFYTIDEVRGMAVEPSTVYTFRVYTHGLAETARQVRLGMWFRDQNGEAIGGDFTWSSFANAGQFQGRTHTLTAPANARYVILALDWDAMAQNEEQVFLFPMLFEGNDTLTPFEPPVAAKICVHPQRLNLAKNANFTNSDATWDTNGTAGAGVLTMANPGTLATADWFPALSETPYVIGVLADVTSAATWEVTMTWADLSDILNPIYSTSVQSATLVDGFNTLVLASPAGAQFAKMSMATTGTGSLDKVLITNDSRREYFDGDFDTGALTDFRYQIPNDRNTFSFYSHNFDAIQQVMEDLAVEFVPVGVEVLWDWDCLGSAEAPETLTMADLPLLYASMNALAAANATMDDIPEPDI